MTALIFDFKASLPDQLYWDASFLTHTVYPGGRYHLACSDFLGRLNRVDNTQSYISTLTLDETIFTLLQLRLGEDHLGRNFWELYNGHPHVIQPYLAELRALIDRLLVDPRIEVVGTEPELMPVALDYMEKYAFLPRDALHLATLVYHGLNSIVTTDSDFLPVDGLQVYTCNPKILSKT